MKLREMRLWNIWHIVLSLDETCRELNRKYILPIGYERNNMFLTDWSEEEFAELDFYDMFDLFYQEIIRRTESLLLEMQWEQARYI